MTQKIHNLDVQLDFLEKQANAKPLPALCEFIWNSLDANATKVELFVTKDKLGLDGEIIIRDNGHGMKPSEAEDCYKKLGGSWKKSAFISKIGNRKLHGKEGQGRFKGFALGSNIDWKVVFYNDSTKKFEKFTISISNNNLKQVTITDPVESQDKSSGVEVKITGIQKDHKILKTENATQPLSEVLALYLKNYSGISISFNGERIDPSLAIKNTKSYDLDFIEFEEEKYPFSLEVIEWKSSTDKTLYLCNEAGFPLSQTSQNLRIGNFPFSGYLKSSFIEKLHNENRLELGEMEPILKDKIEQSKNLIKEYFRERSAQEAKTLVEQWKAEEVYPYKAEPISTMQNIEQKVFDILAVNINDYLPDFQTTPKKQKALHLRLLKQAIEESPEELQTILNEVLDLPKSKQKELAELLQETSLSAFISASKMIADRLRFVSSLEAILYEKDIKKNLKERSQLHKMVADHTWIFGEEFNLSVSDQSLTEVLRKHLQAKNREDIIVDEAVKRIDGKVGIVDLMLTKSIKTTRSEELEHLIVELKAPSVVIGQTEINQLENYAFAVASDERFRDVDTKWNFWLISNDLDEHADRRAKQSGYPKGVVHRSDDGKITLWVKPWSEIINSNKAKLKFIQEELEYQADKGNALKHLQETYKSIIEGTKVEEHIEKAIENSSVN